MTAPDPRSYTAIVASTLDEPWLDEALASIRRQELPPLRTIVVVNGAGAAECALTKRLRLADDLQVESLEVAGQAAAYALGISLATTSYVAFLDADDIWVPGKHSRQIAMLEADPQGDAVSGMSVKFTATSPVASRLQKALAARSFGATTFRRAAFTSFGMPDATATHFVWAYRWWLTAARRGISVLSDDQIALERRVHDRNSWVTDRDRGKQQLLTELRMTMQARRGAL